MVIVFTGLYAIPDTEASNLKYDGSDIVTIPPIVVNNIEAIFAEHHDWLRARLRRSIGDAFAADDVAAETFAQLLATPLSHHIREPKALLTTVSQRIVYEIWRRRDLEQACLQALAHFRSEEYVGSPEDHMLLLEALRAMDRALAGLSSRECAAFLLYKLDDLTYPEIALQLEISASVARRYVAKGLLHCYKACSFAPLA